MGLRSTWEKLYLAVHTLALTDAPLKERLGSAFPSSLLALTLRDFAEGDLQHDFESLYDVDAGHRRGRTANRSMAAQVMAARRSVQPEARRLRQTNAFDSHALCRVLHC
jgi:hypothetical protein